MKKDHILIVDASGFAFRSFYVFPPAYRESDGQPIGAILGFMAMLFRMLGAASADAPTHAAAVFDAPGKNFRHTLFPQYKANRAPARDVELTDQMPFMRHAAEALGLTPIEKTGFEADDVIATLVTRARAAGIRSTIVSSDKDFAQLVVDDWIEIVDPMKKARVRSADVIARFGVEPYLVAHVQALAGDSVDGIPGLKACGLGTAQKLVRRFGSVEDVIANVDTIRFKRVKAELKKRADEVRLYLKLTTLDRNVDLSIELDAFKSGPIYRSHIERMLRVLEASDRLQSLFDLDDAVLRRSAPTSDNPWAWWIDELLAPGQAVPSDPQCGYFQCRLVKRGPLVAARIFLRSGAGKKELLCEINGERRDPLREWPRLAPRPIAKETYDFMVADAKHAVDHRPSDPKADPRKPINLREFHAVTNPKRKAS